MHVIKRDGRQERVMFDKITSRIQKLCYGLNMDFVDPAQITMKVIQGLYSGVTTVELDTLAAETAATLTTKHPDYAILAARIAVSNLHKETKKVFSDVMEDLYNYINPHNGKHSPMVAKSTLDIVLANKDRLNSAIIYDRDFSYNYFGFKTLERSYLLKINGKVAERPQHMLMRVSVGIHKEDIDAAIETYNLLSERWFTHASPTLFNAGTNRPQLSSCFLLSMKDDSIEGIYDTLKQCAFLQARGAVLNILYRKTSQLGPKRPPAGEALNLLGTDSERLLNFAGSFHEAWGLPLQLAITLYLLHQQVGVAFVGGLILAVLLVPVNKVIATRIMASNQEMLQHKDTRVKLMTELLSGIRVIKFFGWEQVLGVRVEAFRAQELGRLRVIKYLDAACVYLWAALPVVISIVIFITYVLMGHQLTATKVFTALALVRMLILPLNNFPWVINGLLEAKVSLDRIQRFLDFPNYNPKAYYSQDPPTEPSAVLELHEALFSWDPVGTSQETFISHLEVKKGVLVGIVGKVGCGKSSLLAAIAGELHRLRGRVAVWELSKGFGLATQEPWIQFATIRDNILFGKTFDAQLYKEVLEACALNDDLSILPAGDQTEVGEKGVTLSGGQRARIALARAVYQEKELYLLDDPLAAVDADVANHLLHRCILGTLSHTTRLLCTHRTEYLEKADLVLLLEAGRLVQAGPPSEILPLVQAVPKVWPEDGGESDSAPAQSVWNPEKTEEGPEVEESTSGRLLQEESKKEGAVAFHVYRAYWRAIGLGLALAILSSLLLMQATRNAADWWLSHWVSQLKTAKNSSWEVPAPTILDSNGLLSAQLLLFSPRSFYTSVFLLPKAAPNGSSDIRFYLTVYATIAGVNSLCTLLRAVLFAAGTLRAAATLHRRLLQRVLLAPVTFFDSTPMGRVLNRFSSDVACVDDSLPFILNILLANAAGLLGLLAVLGSGLPWLLLLLPPLSVIYYRVQRHYRASSRELRRLGSLSLSPLYTHLADTLAGLPVLRASGATDRFEEENQRLLELNQRCQFASSATMQWLDIRLQLMGAAVVSAIAGIALVQHQQGLADPELRKLSLKK